MESNWLGFGFTMKTALFFFALLLVYLARYPHSFYQMMIRTIKPNIRLKFLNHSFSIEGDNNAFTIFYFTFLVTGLSNIYRIIVIALSCIVFVLLIAVAVLAWHLLRALKNKREKKLEGGTSYGVKQHDTPRDQHVSQGDEYMEPLKVLPPATSHNQSIQSNGTSPKYVNVASNIETDNGQEDELYLTIIP